MHQHHNKHHKVKVHKWLNGELSILEHVFNDYWDAMVFAESQKYDHINAIWPVVKVTNELDEVVHQTGSDITTAYA
jgi:hypothetical protein